MDEELQQLEAELKQLRPRTVSPGLRQRLARELEPRIRLRWVWTALPIAAALALLLTLNRSDHEVPTAAAPAVAQATTRPTPEVYRPVSVENVLYASEDEGIVTLENGARVHRVREAYVDTVTWRNPQTNASLRWSVPREEVRVVPVYFQ